MSSRPMTSSPETLVDADDSTGRLFQTRNDGDQLDFMVDGNQLKVNSELNSLVEPLSPPDLELKYPVERTFSKATAQTSSSGAGSFINIADSKFGSVSNGRTQVDNQQQHVIINSGQQSSRNGHYVTMAPRSKNARPAVLQASTAAPQVILPVMKGSSGGQIVLLPPGAVLQQPQNVVRSSSGRQAVSQSSVVSRPVYALSTSVKAGQQQYLVLPSVTNAPAGTVTPVSNNNFVLLAPSSETHSAAGKGPVAARAHAGRSTAVQPAWIISSPANRLNGSQVAYVQMANPSPNQLSSPSSGRSLQMARLSSGVSSQPVVCRTTTNRHFSTTMNSANSLSPNGRTTNFLRTPLITNSPNRRSRLVHVNSGVGPSSSSPVNNASTRIRERLERDGRPLMQPNCRLPFTSLKDAFERLSVYHYFNIRPDVAGPAQLDRVDREFQQVSVQLCSQWSHLRWRFARHKLRRATRRSCCQESAVYTTELARLLNSALASDFLSEKRLAKTSSLQEFDDYLEQFQCFLPEDEAVEASAPKRARRFLDELPSFFSPSNAEPSVDSPSVPKIKLKLDKGSGLYSPITPQRSTNKTAPTSHSANGNHGHFSDVSEVSDDNVADDVDTDVSAGQTTLEPCATETGWLGDGSNNDNDVNDSDANNDDDVNNDNDSSDSGDKKNSDKKNSDKNEQVDGSGSSCDHDSDGDSESGAVAGVVRRQWSYDESSLAVQSILDF